MRLNDLLSLVFYNLSRRKGRVALTAIGVVIGTAAVVLLVALGAGLQRNANNQFAGMADMTMITVQMRYDMPVMEAAAGAKSSQPGGGSTPKQLNNAAIQEISSLPGVGIVIPRDSLRYVGGRIKYGKLENYPYTFAMGTDDFATLGWELLDGTLELKRGEALIGETAMNSFMDPNWRPGQNMPEQPNLLGQQVKFILQRWTQDGTMVEKTINLRIVGVLKERRAETDYAMVVRMEDLTAWNEWGNGGKRINRNKEGYETLMVRAIDSKQTVALSEEITNLGYQAYTASSFVEGINNFYTIIQVVFGGIGAIALLVAAIGIANTMTMSILERTREIGLMKAVGATNRNVLTIFLGEAAGIGLIGGLGGVGLAWLAAQAVNLLAASYLASQAAMMGGEAGQATYIAPWLPVFALAFSTLVGLLSGLYPALRAATMVPVMALKYE